MTGSVAVVVTVIFETDLLYDVHEGKEWNRCGRQLFMEKVQYYVGRNRRIDMALPAFPCKSTNPEKVASQLPDGTEYEALLNLAQFCRKVQSVYSHGCCINLVSDGHVFSDCTGVNDLAVRRYTKALKVMSNDIFHGELERCIQFHTLPSLLFPDQVSTQLFLSVVHQKNTPDYISPINTQTDIHSHLSRLLLIRGFAPPLEFIQDLIARVPEHTITLLYRGFSRFMLDDLAAHPSMQSCKSKTARKKLAESAALEMIRRNQAYSRLVEMVMPRHIRLSIHAHDNAGPKFAIKLLSFTPLCEPCTISDEDAAKAAKEHLHIPTPWHASLMEINRRDEAPLTVVCKAQMAREFIEKSGVGFYNKNHTRGGRFVVMVQDGKR